MAESVLQLCLALRHIRLKPFSLLRGLCADFLQFRSLTGQLLLQLGHCGMVLALQVSALMHPGLPGSVHGGRHGGVLFRNRLQALLGGHEARLHVMPFGPEVKHLAVQGITFKHHLRALLRFHVSAFLRSLQCRLQPLDFRASLCVGQWCSRLSIHSIRQDVAGVDMT